MENRKRKLPLLAYYFLVASITNLAFIAIVWIIEVLFATTIELDTIIIISILVFLFLQGVFSSFIVYSAHRNSNGDNVLNAKLVGLLSGRFYSIFIGVIAGAKIADETGSIVGSKVAGGIGILIGVITCYIAKRWLGPQVGLLVGCFPG